MYTDIDFSTCANELPPTTSISQDLYMSQQEIATGELISNSPFCVQDDTSTIPPDLPAAAVQIDETTTPTIIDNDIAVAILKAFQLMEDMKGSHENLIDIVNYGKELYCKGNSDLLNRWPTSWSACISVLKKAGYTEPITFYACLNPAHQCFWSITDKAKDVCKYCNQKGSIEFYYLKLADKIRPWCRSKTFCAKMTAHWRQKENWINGPKADVLNELWDGERFAELSWFWDPDKQWLIPTRCGTCQSIISADQIATCQQQVDEDADSELASSNILDASITIECPQCHICFNHSPSYAFGDPRNIALIGHWDGWQPFSTSIKHSCGRLIQSHTNILHCM